MLNPKVREIYPEITVKELENIACVMERQGRKVCLGLPSNRVPGQVFPQFVGFEDLHDEEVGNLIGMLYTIYSVLTRDRPFFEDDTEYMSPGRYTTVSALPGSVDLWVK